MTSPVSDDCPSVWTPQDFPEESNWSFELNPPERQALIAHGRGRPLADLQQRLGATATRWANLLNDGPGFVRLRGFPLDALSEWEVKRAYVGLGRLLGTPIGQDRTGSIITHIRDERNRARPGRTYQTNLRQDFHCDASDLVGLLCLQSAKNGGVSRIVSAHTVYNQMVRHDRHLVELMYEPMPWSRHPHTHPGTAPYFLLAPITEINGVPRIFFIPWYIRNSQLHATAPRLTEDQLAALALMEHFANDSSLQIEMNFRPGDIQLLNNSMVLHSRGSYEDHDNPDLRRHLLRLWLATDQSSTELLPTAPPRNRLGYT